MRNLPPKRRRLKYLSVFFSSQNTSLEHHRSRKTRLRYSQVNCGTRVAMGIEYNRRQER